MDQPDNRRFPRIPHITTRQIVRLDELQTPKKNIILTQNLSAGGLRFTANEDIKTASSFLIHLNDLLSADMQLNGKNLLKSGDFYLSRVVWTNRIRNNVYEIGASFLEKKNSLPRDIETFTELVNISMLDLLPEITPANP